MSRPPIGIGIIGSGGLAQCVHLPAYKKLQKQMLDLDSIDAVDICTPNYLHYEPTLAAFAGGG